MLELLDNYNGDPATLVAPLTAMLKTESSHSDRTQVSKLETLVQSDPAGSFRYDADGFATLQGFAAGRFETPSLGELRTRANALAKPGPRVRLWVMDGTNPLTDIGALQGSAAPDSLFQVASQFNCLESPGPHLVRVGDYFFDPTQGPRASISAYPGTLLRHYQAPAPDGSCFVQGDRQINLLHRLGQPVQSGYLRSGDVTDPGAFAAHLEGQLDDLEVGLHDGVQVVLGANWDAPVPGTRRIAQVFTSTVAAGGYSRTDTHEAFPTIIRQLQRGAYLGTLLGAAALGKRRVCLTLIGGGVFGNPVDVIWEAIQWAVDQIQPYLHNEMTVVVNSRTLGESIPSKQLRQAAVDRGGELLACRGQRFLVGPEAT